MSKSNLEQQRFELKADTENRIVSYVEELRALFYNAVTFGGVENGISTTWILKNMLENGCVGKDLRDGKFYRLVSEATLDAQGEPSKYTLVAGNGKVKSAHVGKDTVVVYRANKAKFPYIGRFMQCARDLALMDNSITVNLLNSQTTSFIPCDSEEIAMNMRNAFDDAYLGMPLVVGIKRAMGEEIPKVLNSDFQFIADQICDLKNRRWEDELKRCGIITANDYKRERVQTAEVNAGVGESIDYIYSMIDTFNQDAECAGQPERMQFNGYTQKFDNWEDYV